MVGASAVALAALHSTAGLAAGPRRTQRRTKQLRPGAGPCTGFAVHWLASWAPAGHDADVGRALAETPARRAPRQGPWTPGHRRKHQSSATPKAGIQVANPHLNICSSSSSSSSRTRHTTPKAKGNTSTPVKIVSCNFRVCRHG